MILNMTKEKNKIVKDHSNNLTLILNNEAVKYLENIKYSIEDQDGYLAILSLIDANIRLLKIYMESALNNIDDKKDRELVFEEYKGMIDYILKDVEKGIKC